MRYCVFGYKIDGQDPIRINIEIDHDRFIKVGKAKDTCLFGLELEEKLQLLLENLFEFEVELLKLAQASLLWPSQIIRNAMQERLILDRRVVNLLTSCRLYLDQTDHGLSNLYGNPSEELKGIKEFKSGLYDDHWGYRFMEALRNHVQHSGLPVHQISYNSGFVSGKSGDHIQYKVIPDCSVKTLSENKEFKKSILKELEAKGDYIDLRTVVREYVSCLVLLHHEIRNVIALRFLSAREEYKKTIQEFSKLNGHPVQHSHLCEINDDGNVSEKIELPQEFLDRYDCLLKRNQANQNIQTSFASNSDKK